MAADEASALILGISLGKLGWNLRNDAHAMASWTIPSCHMKEAKTARIHSATVGDIASLTASRTRSPGREPDRDLEVGVLSVAGEEARSLLLRSVLPRSLRFDLGDKLKRSIRNK